VAFQLGVKNVNGLQRVTQLMILSYLMEPVTFHVVAECWHRHRAFVIFQKGTLLLRIIPPAGMKKMK
jgi:hypothetical protein